MKKIRIINWTKNNFQTLAIGLIFSILSSGAAASLPFLVSESTKLFEEKWENSTNGLLIILAIMFGLGIFSLVFGFLSKYFLAKLSTDQIASVRFAMNNKIQMSTGYELREYNSSSLITRMSIDLYNMTIYYNWLIINAIPSIIRFTIFTVVVLVLNYIIGFSMLGLAILLFIGCWLISRKSVKYYEKALGDVEKINAITDENILGIRVTKAFNLRRIQMERFEKANDSHAKNQSSADSKTFQSISFSLAFINATSIIIVLIASLMKFQAFEFAGTRFDVATILSIFSYSYLVLWSTFDVVFIYIYYVRSVSSRKRIHDILALETSQLIPTKKKQEFKYGDIEFKNVYFKYFEDSENYVLKNINFTIPKNSTLGIIGSTGSGKSSLMKLLTKNWFVNEGEILINNTNINDIDTNSLLSNLSMAFQKKLLFSGSIRDNIKFADNSITDKQINKVLEIAQLKDFVDAKEEKLDFKLEEGARNLSGGQQQRLNIARAIAKKAKIYIFDDATSALDNITETKVINRIKKEFNNAIVIIAAEKITSIQDLDQIIVVDKGKIVGIGKHNDLIKNNTKYREICKNQNIEVD